MRKLGETAGVDTRVPELQELRACGFLTLGETLYAVLYATLSKLLVIRPKF